MKTTVDIADGLMRAAKARARAREQTLRELIEEGLRLVLERDPEPRFKLKDGSFHGDGMLADFSWEEIRALSYGDRGGQ